MIRLKYERLNRRLSQTHLARLAGLFQTEVSGIERGRIVPDADELRRLADALDVSPEALLEEVAVERAS